VAIGQGRELAKPDFAHHDLVMVLVANVQLVANAEEG
jgi:hypothetical protein